MMISPHLNAGSVCKSRKYPQPSMSKGRPHKERVRKDQQRHRRKLGDPHSFPFRYEVFVQARVREGCALNTAHITDLPVGSIVTVEEIKQNRARISAPCVGWLSIVSKLGKYIIMQRNEQTDKIGRKVIISPFPIHKYNKLQCKQLLNATVIDYNPKCNLHQIQYQNGVTQWMHLHNNPSVHYIQKTRAAHPMEDIRKNEQFFTQFFVRDYPEFLQKDNSPSPSPSPSQHVNNQKNKNKNKVEMKPEIIPKTKKQNLSNVIKENKKNKLSEAEKTKKYDKNSEFVQKVKAIEQKIIEHLHLRGYREDNPDFWKYLEKSRKMAIEKARKCRERYLEQQKLRKRQQQQQQQSKNMNDNEDEKKI